MSKQQADCKERNIRRQLTAQVKLQADNVDEVLKAMTLVPYKLSKQHTVKCHDVMKPSMPL